MKLYSTTTTTTTKSTTRTTNPSKSSSSSISVSLSETANNLNCSKYKYSKYKYNNNNTKIKIHSPSRRFHSWRVSLLLLLLLQIQLLVLPFLTLVQVSTAWSTTSRSISISTTRSTPSCVFNRQTSSSLTSRLHIQKRRQTFQSLSLVSPTHQQYIPITSQNFLKAQQKRTRKNMPNLSGERKPTNLDDTISTSTSTSTALFQSSTGSSAAAASDDGNDKQQSTFTSSSSSSSSDIQQQKQQQNDNINIIRRRRQISVGAILISAFLNLLGFTMAGPITPALGNHFQLPIGASFGSLTSAYPLGMLFGLFVWPSLSDQLGRKPIICASLFGSGLGLLAQAIVIQRHWSLTWFLACRAFTGAFAGSSPVSKAYLADVGYKDGKLPRYLALRDAASTMAFIVGPMMGGILYDIIRRRMVIHGSAEMTKLQVLSSSSGSLAFVIGISAVASLAAAILVAVLVQDVKENNNKKNKSSKKQGQTAGNIADGNTKDNAGNTAVTSEQQQVENDNEENNNTSDIEEELIACPLGRQMWTGVASVCVVSFLFNVGDSTFHAFFSALVRDVAGKATVDIGMLYTLLACVSFIVSTTGSSYMMKQFGPVLTCAVGLGFVGTGLSALGIASAMAASSASGGAVVPRFAILAAAAGIYYCGVPLYGPTIPTMLLRCVPSNRRGAIMGLDGTINTIARIISPLIMGDIYRRYGPGSAFGLAGIAAFGGVITTLFRRFVVLNDLYVTKNDKNNNKNKNDATSSGVVNEGKEKEE